MGCDWISAGASMIGYTVSYAYFFHQTPFASFEKIYDEETYEEYEIEENARNAREELKRNPRKVAGDCWTKFLAERHSSLVDLNLTIFVGPTAMPGAYETGQYTNSCIVGFGYKLEAKDPLINSSERVFNLSFRFPENMKAIIEEFIAYFKEQHPVVVEPESKKTKRDSYTYSYTPRNDVSNDVTVFSYVC